MHVHAHHKSIFLKNKKKEYKNNSTGTRSKNFNKFSACVCETVVCETVALELLQILSSP